MSNDSTQKTVFFTLGVCLVCSILVSYAAVTLKGRQRENRKLEKLRNILIAGDMLEEKIDIIKIYQERIRPEIIDLKTGKPISEKRYNDLINVEEFDINRVAKDPVYGQTIPQERDLAKIKRMPRFMIVYKVVENGQIERFILPVYGKGLWSTMYGFIALDKDLRTIKGFTFYEHGETPGLGGEVDSPLWKQIWVGKQAFDDHWNVKIEVIKGRVNKFNPDAKYQIDGLSGSTITTRGVNQLVKFWLGENGYGPYIRQLIEEG